MVTKQHQNKILIIEPSEIVTRGLTSMLESVKDFCRISSITDLSVYHNSAGNPYDIIILNPQVVNYDKRTDIRALLSINLGTLLFAISYTPYDDNIMHQYDGSIYINDTKSQIYKKLKSALDNTTPAAKVENNDLSARERDIITAVAQGKTNKEIADNFNLSIHTVVTHRKNISNKLGINSISGLTVYAILNKLIDPTEY